MLTPWAKYQFLRNSGTSLHVNCYTHNACNNYSNAKVCQKCMPPPSVQRRKVWLTPTTRVPCSNAAKTRNPLKFAGVPQTGKPISAVSGPTFTTLWEHMEDILLFTKFSFPIVDTCLSSEDTARQNCAMVLKWRILCDFLHPVFSASCVQYILDLHPKFALRPHHVLKYGRHPICDGWEQARKKDRKN